LLGGPAEMPDTGDGIEISELFERDHLWISFSDVWALLIRLDLIGNPS
jgi:hypothetical protein